MKIADKLMSCIMIVVGIMLMILSLIGYMINPQDISNVFALVMAFGTWIMERLLFHE